MSETVFKRHDNPAVSSQSTINSQSSSRTSSNSSDTMLTAMNGFGSVKRKGSKNKGNFLTKGDKKASLSRYQRNDPSSTSRSSAPSVLDTIKCTMETSLSASTGVIQTSAMATSTKSTMSTMSSSSKQAWMHGRNLISSGGMSSITSRQPQAADIPDCSGSSSSSSIVTNSSVPSSHALHKRRTSAPVFSSRMVSTGVNYAASVKANLPSTTTTTAITQQPSSPLSVTTLHNASPNSSTIYTNTTNTASTSTLESDNTYTSHTLSSGGKPLKQDVSRDCNNSTGTQNLVAASDSINLILQDLDSAAAVRKTAAGRGKQPAAGEASTDHYDSEVVDNSNDIDVLEQEWDNNNLFPLSNENTTVDDKISEFSTLFCLYIYIT